MPRIVTQREVIARFRKAHGNRYDYRRVKYFGMKVPVEVICRTHGSFFPPPMHHITGTACPRCKYLENGKARRQLMAKAFINRAIKTHKNKYDYSQTRYISNKEKVKIVCPTHGAFFQTPSNHLYGFGCQECALSKMQAARKLSSKDFFRRCKVVHKGRYKYPSRTYSNPDSIIDVTCPQHGHFKIVARNHLWIRQGCFACFGETRGLSKRIPWKTFIAESKNIHDGLYKYDKASYSMGTEKMRIFCFEHGWFSQQPNRHLRGQGCPICARQATRGRWVASNIPPELRKNPCILYCMILKKRREEFCKIGITNDLKRRTRTILLHSGYEVSVEMKIQTTLYKAMQIEAALLKKLKHLRYRPLTEFAGYTECFHLKILSSTHLRSALSA